MPEFKFSFVLFILIQPFFLTPGQPYLFGLAGFEDVTGHLGLGVVRLAPQQIGEIREVVAVVDETRDELRFVLEYEHGRVAAAGRHAADERRVDDQLHLSGLHSGAAVALLAPPADLRHQPGQHRQRGPPVQRRPADVRQGDPAVGLGRAALPLIPTLHVDPSGRVAPKILPSEKRDRRSPLKVMFHSISVGEGK